MNFNKSKRPQKSLEDPEYDSNVNSVILDWSENTTLVHTNQMNRGYIHQYRFWMQKMQFGVYLETQLLDTKKVWNGAKSLWTIGNTFQMKTVPFKIQVKIQLWYTQTKWTEDIYTSTNFECKECNLGFIWKHNFWTRQKSLKWGKESLDDRKYLSNDNCAI